MVIMLRVFDIAFSLIALVVLSPLFIVAAVMLRFTGEGEIFYRQTRIGRGGYEFWLYKFATMLKASPSLGTGTVTIKEDPRILPVGGLLRRTKVNELPQLLNILIGDMSVIGPRPQTQEAFNAFPQDFRKEILSVRPGLSGIGSIVFRDEEGLLAGATDHVEMHHGLFMPYKAELESWYVCRQGLYVYFKLILITAWIVINPRSLIVWRIFDDLPAPSPELGTILKVPWLARDRGEQDEAGLRR